MANLCFLSCRFVWIRRVFVFKKTSINYTNIAHIYLYLFPRKKWQSWKNGREIPQRSGGSGRNTLTAHAPKGTLKGLRELSSSFRTFGSRKQESWLAHYQNVSSALKISEGRSANLKQSLGIYNINNVTIRVSLPVTKLPVIYGAPKFINLDTEKRHFSLSRSESIPRGHILFKIHFNITVPSMHFKYVFSATCHMP